MPQAPSLQKQHASATPHLSNFWDHLSTIHLTRRALRELNRRNNLRDSPAERALPASDSRLSDIIRFARQGGPDLSDIVGVSWSSLMSGNILVLEHR